MILEQLSSQCDLLIANCVLNVAINVNIMYNHLNAYKTMQAVYQTCKIMTYGYGSMRVNTGPYGRIVAARGKKSRVSMLK